MEGSGCTEAASSGSGGAPSGSRWNPTKEQIDLLENLYRQGLRTPSAEQIEQITSKLRAFGHIEGKNVFYWFQNHKARQRQKQKQENFAIFNTFLHHPQPPPPPPYQAYPNVACRPYYIQPSSDYVYRPHYPKAILPGFYKQRPVLLSAENNIVHTKPTWNHQRESLGVQSNDNYEEGFIDCNINHANNQETLELFPLHPTGNLQVKRGTSGFSSSLPSTSNVEDCYKPSSAPYGNNPGGGVPPFIDFFCVRAAED